MEHSNFFEDKYPVKIFDTEEAAKEILDELYARAKELYHTKFVYNIDRELPESDRQLFIFANRANAKETIYKNPNIRIEQYIIHDK